MSSGEPRSRRPRRASFPALALALVLLSPGAAEALEDASGSLRQEAQKWLSGYLRIDTTNPPGNEAAAAAYLARILHSEGLSTRLLVTPSGRTNLYARLEANRPGGEGAVVLLHHMDVVAAGDGWTHVPFGGHTDRHRMWGRGAIDAKSLGVAHLAAFIDEKRSGRPRHRDLVFLAVADEETGGREGAGWLLAEHPELFDDVAGVLNEGGSNRTVGEKLLWWGVEVAQKRPLWLKVKTSGRGGHGSAYNPRSASHRLVGGLANLLTAPPRYRVSEATRDYFAAIAPFHNQAFRDVFTHPDLDVVRSRFNQVLEGRSSQPVLLPGMLAYFQDTVQVTSVNSSTTTVNVVPESVEATIDIRLLPDTPTKEMMEILRERLGPTAEIEVLLSSPIAPPSTTRTAIYDALEEALSTAAPLVPALITGTTDSRYFRERGIPAYGFSPFILSGDEARGIHGTDESIPLGKFREGIDVMLRVVRSCLAA